MAPKGLACIYTISMGERCHYKTLSQISFSFSPFFCITAIDRYGLWAFCARHSQPTRLKNCGKYVAQKLGLGAKPLAGFLFVPPVGVYPLYPLYVVQYGGVQLAVA
jgi:hypothetical protein